MTSPLTASARPLPGRRLLLALAGAVALLVGNGLLTAPTARAADVVTAAATHGAIGGDAATTTTWHAGALDVHDGDAVPLRFTVTGAAGDALRHVRIALPGCDDGSITGAVPGDTGTFDLLDGSPLAWTCRLLVAADDAPVGTAGVEVVDADTGEAIATDDFDVTIVRPALSVSERLADGVRPEVTVQNVGTVPLLVNAADPHCLDGFTSGVPAGADGHVDQLAVGATETLSCDLVPGRFVAGAGGDVVVTGSDRTGGLTTVRVAAESLPGPTAVAGAAAAPTRKGSAHLLRPVGCQRSSFAIQLLGDRVSSVVLRIDGKRATFANTSSSKKAWTLVFDVRRLGVGEHLLQATVHFDTASHTPARTLTRHVRVCRRAALQAA